LPHIFSFINPAWSIILYYTLFATCHCILKNLKLPEKYLEHLPRQGNGGLLDNPGHSGHLRTGSDVIYRQEELLHEVLKATRLKTSPIQFQKSEKYLLFLRRAKKLKCF
jgi:hypothetical protein